MNQYFQEINDSMINIDNIINDITINSSEYTILASSKDQIKLNNAMYTLNKELSNQMNMQPSIVGFVINNAQSKSRRYLFQKDISSENKEELLKQIMNLINSNNIQEDWNLVLTGNTCYCVKINKKKSGAIAGVFEIENDIGDIVSNIHGNVKFYLLLNNMIMNNSEKTFSIPFDILNRQSTQIETKYNKGKDLKLEGFLKDKENYQGKKEKELIYYNSLKGTGIGVCIAIEDTIWNYLQFVQIILLVITLSSMFGVAFLYRFLMKQILWPLQELTYTMNEIGQGNIHAKMESDYQMMEFDEMKNTFHRMMGEIQELKIESYEERIHKQKAQLLYYQLQLKPHFYLNCLKTLNALLSEKQYDRMQDLIFDISSHMRYLLQSDKELVMVQSELEFVRNYVNLQKNNYSRKVILEVQMDPTLSEKKIPALTVQTFVENTFKYARMQEGEDLLYIQIKGILLKTEEGKYIDILVKDNGCGYSEKVLEILNGPVEGIKAAGVGIANLLWRCNLIYNGKVEYSFLNEEGAVSELIIPYDEEGIVITNESTNS